MKRPLQAVALCLLAAPICSRGADDLLHATAATRPAATQPAARLVTATISPDARKALDEIDAAYAKLTTLKLAGTISFDADVAGKQQKQSNEFTATFAAPNKFRHEVKADILSGSTGEKAYALSLSDNVYVQKDAPQDGRSADGWPKAVWSILSSQNASLAMALSPQASNQLIDGATSIARSSVRGATSTEIEKATDLTKVQDIQLDGHPFHALKLTNPGGEFTFLIDPHTHLLRRLTVDQRKVLEAAGQPAVKKVTLTFDYAATETGAAIDPKQFAWTPPANARELSASSQDSQDSAGSELVGKPAPDFKLTSLDGKTTVHLVDLKGSLVVLDFWAAGCPTCVESLPGLDRFAKERTPTGIKIFAISEDDDKEKVKPFIVEHALSLNVLLDDEHKAAEAYGVQAIPHTVVIGKDGHVKSIVATYGPGGDERLAKAVDEAMK